MTERLRKLQFAMLDLVVFQFAYTISSHIVKKNMTLEIPSSLKGSFFIVIFSILSIMLFFITNVYVEDMMSKKIISLKRSFAVCFPILISLILSQILLQLINKGYGLSLILLSIYYVLVSFSLLLCRAIYGQYQRIALKNKNNTRNILIIASSEEIKKHEAFINEHKYLNYKIVSYINLEEDNNICGIDDLQEMINIVRMKIVDEVIVSGHIIKNEELKAKLSICRDMGVVVTVLIDLYDEVSENTKMMVYSDFPRIKYSDISLNAGQLFIKRFIDILGSIIGLIIFGISFVIFGPIIKIESIGPILFKQNRVGKNGRIFTIYKYRSMYMDAEERKKELMEKNEMSGHMFKIKDDPRITKVGKFIRKTSIDELPQFINVFLGDMSLVGTRPPTVDEVSKYEYRHYKRIAAVPGLTGKWQVSGRSDIVDFEEVVKMDVDYITRWTIWEDIRIILLTMKIILFGKGAR